MGVNRLAMVAVALLAILVKCYRISASPLLFVCVCYPSPVLSDVYLRCIWVREHNLFALNDYLQQVQRQ